MAKTNTIGVDLAKNVIQVSVLSGYGKELQNKEMTRIKFAEFLAKQKPSLVAYESCATAHYWSRYARQYGHQTKIIPAKAVTPFRQGHKTDKNDALAIAEAANRPNIKEAPMKSVEQQGFQSIQRSRELLIHDKTALSNHIWGILMEFGVFIPKGWAYLTRHVPLALEDAENDIPDLYRPTLHRMFERFRTLSEDIEFLDQQIKHLVKQGEACTELMNLEGVGPIGAILLFASFGTGQAFRNGREFSAYIGLTPKQFSSGGKTNIIGISRHVANRRLRAVLIQGARAHIYKAKYKDTAKQRWLSSLIERSGHNRAAIALANKNVRTAWAMLTNGTAYESQRAQSVAA